MRSTIYWLLFSLLILPFAASDAAAQQPARATSGGEKAIDPLQYSKAGNPSGCLVNGLDSALSAAQIDDGGASTLYKKYNDTYGPCIDSLGFQIKRFFYSGTTMNSKTGMWNLIRAGFLISVAFVGLLMIWKATNGQATINDVGWSLSKVGLGVLLLSAPGLVYMLLVSCSLLVCGMIAAGGQGKVGGIDSMAANDVLMQGWKSTVVVASAMTGLAEENTRHVGVTSPSYRACEELNKAIEKYLPDKGSAIGGPIPLTIKTPVADLSGNVTDQDVPRAKLDLSLDFASKLESFVKLWESWPKQSTEAIGDNIKAIQDARSKAEEIIRVELLTSSPDQDTINNAKRDLFDAVAKESQEILLISPGDKSLGLMDRALVSKEKITTGRLAGNVRKNPDDIQAFYKAYGNANAHAAPIREALEKSSKGWVAGILEWVQKIWLGYVMKLVARVWLGLIELLMLQLMIMTPLWIHPKTEASFVKALKALFAVSIFMPCYMIANLVFDTLFMTAATSTGWLSWISVLWTCQAMILVPLVSIPAAVMFAKVIFQGGTLVGGMVKGAMTTVGAAAAVAFPAVRLGTMAASAGLGKAAAGAGAAAAAPGASIGTKAKAWAFRRAAGATDYTQEAMARFSGTDKYLKQGGDKAENRAGAKAATVRGAWEGVKGVVTGKKASDVFEAVHEQGKRRAERQKTPENDSTAKDVADQKAASKTQTAKVQTYRDAPINESQTSQPAKPEPRTTQSPKPVEEVVTTMRTADGTPKPVVRVKAEVDPIPPTTPLPAVKQPVELGSATTVATPAATTSASPAATATKQREGFEQPVAAGSMSVTLDDKEIVRGLQNVGNSLKDIHSTGQETARMSRESLETTRHTNEKAEKHYDAIAAEDKVRKEKTPEAPKTFRR